MKTTIHHHISRTLPLLGLAFLLLQACTEDRIQLSYDGTLAGHVKDFTSDEVLAGVILTTNPATISVATDSTGFFEFSTLSEGDYTLIARKSDYVSESVVISVTHDDTATVVVLLERSSEYNKAPEFGSVFQPDSGEPVDPMDVVLTWTASDPNPEDALSYDIRLFGNGNQEAATYENLSESELILTDLAYNTVYFWQVRAYDAYDTIVSDVHSFQTLPFPDYPILFARETEDGLSAIFSADTTGSLPIRLTIGTRDTWSPRRSPAGQKIAYVSHDNLEAHIYTMDIDGSNSKKITRLPISGYHNAGRGYAWSPRGDKIIYAYYDRILEVGADGTGERTLATAPAGRHFRDLSYAPDGSRIVAQTVGSDADQSELCLIQVSDGSLEVLVDSLSGMTESPSFSLNGNQILFTADVSESLVPDERQLDARIYEIDLVTRRTWNLSEHRPDGTNDLNPRYSSNGAYIIFENTSNESGATPSIWMMDRDGNSLSRRMLFEGARMPDWL
ncbi:MAG: carboxypeptidase regulatory-like domain-containing protein [Bacteroidales bacterium]